MGTVLRGIGISIVAAGKWGRARGARSYREEWRSLAERWNGSYEWVDLVGLGALAGVAATIVVVSLR